MTDESRDLKRNPKPCVNEGKPGFCWMIHDCPNMKEVEGIGTQYEMYCDCGMASCSVQICDLMTLEERQTGWNEKEMRYADEYVARARAETIERWNRRAPPDAIRAAEPCKVCAKREKFSIAVLPKITDEIMEQFGPALLIEQLSTEGPNWTQDAVDFACLVAGHLVPDPPSPPKDEDRIYTKADAEALCAIAVAAATKGTYKSNCERIEKRLMEHRLSYTHGDDGDAYPLVDRLVPDGETTIETGRKEIELLAENIADLFGKPAPPSGAALWGEVTPEGDDAFTDFCTRVWDVPENAPVLGLTVKELRRIYDLARDASPAQGWKLVPVEPTKEMWLACPAEGTPEQVWKAMLKAARPTGEGG